MLTNSEKNVKKNCKSFCWKTLFGDGIKYNQRLTNANHNGK